MPEEKSYRLAKVAGELGVGVHTLVEHLQKKGVKLEDTKPTPKLDQATYEILLQDFQSDKKAKDQSKNIEIQMKRDREHVADNSLAKSKQPVEEVEEEIVEEEVEYEDVPVEEYEEEEVEVAAQPFGPLGMTNFTVIVKQQIQAASFQGSEVQLSASFMTES